MKRFLIATLLLLGFELHALSLQEIIDTALDKKPSLAAIKKRIKANSYTISASNQYANPTIAYAQNTLDASEKMSQKSITFSQKIPYYGKLDTQENITKADDALLHAQLQQAKVALVEAIKKEAYTIWELQRLYDIICDYEDVTRQNIALYESYTSTSENKHMGIMSAELSLSELRIEKSRLKAAMSEAYARVSYLAAFDVTSLEIDLHVDNKLPTPQALLGALQHNPDVVIKEKEVQKARAKVQNATKNNYPDFTIAGGYTYRERYDDFFNIAVAMTLPIYGTEDDKEQESRQLVLADNIAKEDTKLMVNSEFKRAFAGLTSAFEIYHIVQDDALPKVAHMFELTNSSISAGGDLFKYIDILIQKLKLEQKSIKAIASYNRYKAQIDALRGEIQ